MKILSFGLDNLVLDKSSALARRVVKYGELVEKYASIVPNQKQELTELSDKAKAYGSGGGNKLTRFIKIYILAKKLLREEKYDVITVQDQYYLALIGWLAAKEFKLGLEIQIHGWEKYYGIRKLIAKYILPRADAIRCVSQRLKRQLIGEFSVKEEKITVAPIFSDAVPLLLARPSNSSYSSSRGAERLGSPIFLTVGRLVKVKNIDLQIKAMAEIVKKYPKIELWIIGDGPEKKNYELRITNYELQNNIKFFGWQNDLGKYYSQADAFLLTSDSEGWGLAVIEAAGFGLPIIMTEVGLAGEVIKDGESGIIIPAGSKEKLVAAILKIIEDENLRKKLGENAKAAAGRLPTKEQTLELYIRSWRKALINNK